MNLEIANDNASSINSDFSEWLERSKYLHKSLPTVTDSLAKNPINSYYFVECINKVSKANHIFVNDAGSSNYIPNYEGFEYRFTHAKSPFIISFARIR